MRYMQGKQEKKNKNTSVLRCRFSFKYAREPTYSKTLRRTWRRQPSTARTASPPLRVVATLRPSSPLDPRCRRLSSWYRARSARSSGSLFRPPHTAGWECPWDNPFARDEWRDHHFHNTQSVHPFILQCFFDFYIQQVRGAIKINQEGMFVIYVYWLGGDRERERWEK